MKKIQTPDGYIKDDRSVIWKKLSFGLKRLICSLNKWHVNLYTHMSNFWRQTLGRVYNPSKTRPNEYYAFISCTSADLAEAESLQKKLEYYHIPRSFRKNHPKTPDWIRRVFLFCNDLEGNVLAKSLEKYLDKSKKFDCCMFP